MSTELLGYLNMAIGLVGIVLTALTAPSLLHLGAKIRTEALPGEFAGLGAVVRTLSVLLVLTTFMFLLGLGMAMTLTQVTEPLGAARPILTATLIVGALYSAAATCALAIYRNGLAIPGVVGTVGLGAVSFVAALSDEPNAFGLAFTMVIVVFLGTGFFTLMFMTDRGGP